ncbi:MAG: DNA repair protein RecO [Clostridia bacterium]|nr:DNA repair protein RecO [Clostridia bacterium]
MYTETEAIVLHQTKTVNGRRMIVLFSEKYGKIAAGTSINEAGKKKSSLALRPFACGRYELYKNRDCFNINGAEVIHSYYRIGADVDKYIYASYILEFTEKILPEDAAEPLLFLLLKDFLSMMEGRKKAYGTLVLGYLCKAVGLSGNAPDFSACESCASSDASLFFSIKDGSIIHELGQNAAEGNNSLIFPIEMGIIDILKYMFDNPLRSLENLALKEDVQRRAEKIMKAYIAYHLGIEGLKSEALII